MGPSLQQVDWEQVVQLPSCAARRTRNTRPCPGWWMGGKVTGKTASTLAPGNCSSARVSQCSLPQCSLSLCSRSGRPECPLLFPGCGWSLQRVSQITRSGLLHPNGHLFSNNINLLAPHLHWLLTAAGRITKAFGSRRNFYFIAYQWTIYTKNPSHADNQYVLLHKYLNYMA